jgi:hypothetical protein
MRDPYSVLLQKEHDLERVRKEIQALLTVIPLLAEEQPSEVTREPVPAVPPAPVSSPETDMAQLERYYPFVKHWGESERARR